MQSGRQSSSKSKHKSIVIANHFLEKQYLYQGMILKILMQNNLKIILFGTVVFILAFSLILNKTRTLNIIGPSFSLQIPRNWSFSDKESVSDKDFNGTPVKRLIVSPDPVTLDEYGEVGNDNYILIRTEPVDNNLQSFSSTRDYFEWAKTDSQRQNELLISQGKLPITPGFVYSISADQSITPIVGAIALDNDYLQEKGRTFWLFNPNANLLYEIEIFSNGTDFYQLSLKVLKSFLIM